MSITTISCNSSRACGSALGLFLRPCSTACPKEKKEGAGSRQHAEDILPISATTSRLETEMLRVPGALGSKKRTRFHLALEAVEVSWELDDTFLSMSAVDQGSCDIKSRSLSRGFIIRRKSQTTACFAKKALLHEPGISETKPKNPRSFIRLSWACPDRVEAVEAAALRQGREQISRRRCKARVVLYQ